MPASNPTLLLTVVAAGLLLLLAAGVGLARLAARTNSPAQRQALDYRRREAMTASELKFFLRLVEALPEAVVAPQVAMSSLVDLPAHQNKSFANRSKFSQQRLDFVVFDKTTGAALLAIELDDPSHDTPAQQQKDRERDAILVRVGYKVRRFDVRKMPTAVQLRQQLVG